MAIQKTQAKAEARGARKARIRRKIVGTAERPRLSVYRSLGHIYAQVVDDVSRRTLVSASTLSEAVRGDLKGVKKADQAKRVGELLAKLCADKNVKHVVFDRNGFLYHGRVAALAAGARAAGLDF